MLLHFKSHCLFDCLEDDITVNLQFKFSLDHYFKTQQCHFNQIKCQASTNIFYHNAMLPCPINEQIIRSSMLH